VRKFLNRITLNRSLILRILVSKGGTKKMTIKRVILTKPVQIIRKQQKRIATETAPSPFKKPTSLLEIEQKQLM